MVKMDAARPSGSAQAKAGEVQVCCYASCGAELKKPLVCARCKAAAYCCKDCQVKDWKAGHRQACKSKVKASAGDVATGFLRRPSGQASVLSSAVKGNALCLACLDGKMDMVEKLLGEGVSADEPNEDGWTGLQLASLNGHGEVVEKLLDKGATMDVVVLVDLPMMGRWWRSFWRRARASTFKTRLA